MLKPSLIALTASIALASVVRAEPAAKTGAHATIKGVDYHYDIFASPRLAETVLPFLNGQSGAASWADQVKAQTAKAPKK